VEKAPLVRSPLFVFRLVIGLVLTGIGVALLVVFEHALLGLHTDIATLQESWPEWVPQTFEVVVGISLFVTIIATNVGLLVKRRVRRWMMVNAAAIAAAVLSALTAELVLRLATSDVVQAAVRAGGPESSLGNEGLASLIGVLTVAGPWIGRRLRTWAHWIGAGAVSLSFIGGALSVITLPLDVGVGMTGGALMAVLLRTRDRTPSADEVAATLRAAQIAVTDVRRASVDARGSVPWFVTTRDGSELFVKTLGTDQRAADLMFRLYRWIRLRNAGDRRPFTSLERAVEHEALLSLAAASRGIHTPQLVTVAEIGTDGALLAYRRIEGGPLDELSLEAVPDWLLTHVWREVSELHDAGIAHRDLRLANLLMDDKGRPWLIDFGFAELAASESLRARDVAELIGSTATLVGPERAAAAAIEVLGPERVRIALPWIQPLALSTATRTQIGRSDDFKRLRETVAQAVGAEHVTYESIERVSPRTLLVLATIALAGYVLVPQLAEASGFFGELQGADLRWVALAAVASVFTYVAAGIGMVGAVPMRIALWPTVAAQVASSFANRVTPAKVGGMATNVRYFQKQGIPAAAAVSAVGLNTLAGLVIHISALAVTGLVAGASGTSRLPLPSPTVTAVVVGSLIAASGLLMALPLGRKVLTKNLLPAVRGAASSVAAIAKTPSKLTALLTGSAGVTVGYTVAMLASLAAFGAGMAPAQAALVYLAGAAVATAAPTPGGIGATEAALVAGYTAAGVEASVAFAAVLLFRLVTFWLPILPGWWALVVLQRRDQL
jgi:undecaprenyl-diphosphatase